MLSALATTLLLTATDFEFVRRLIELEVALGFSSRAEIIEVAMGSAEETTREEVTRLVDEALRQHQSKQKTWKRRTDSDRLSAAFDALNRQGIVAREHFSMTWTSGRGELREVLAKNPKLKGYVFYTPQDLQTVFEDKGVFLTLGSAAPDLDALQAVVKTIVLALQKEGLAPEYDGMTKVWVPLTWQKRRKP